MGIKERKEREKEELRQLILDTALKQFEENGFEKVSMRTISKEIEYSPTTIYLYFKNKDELMFELSKQAFAKFFQALSVVQDLSDPMDRLAQLGSVYIDFAINNTGLYNLMFILQHPMRGREEEKDWKMGMQSHSILTNTVNECKEKGYFKGLDANSMALTIWSFTHGLSTMKVCDRMDMYNEMGVEKMMKEALENFNKLLRNFK